MDVRTGSKSWGYSKRPRNWKKIMYKEIGQGLESEASIDESHESEARIPEIEEIPEIDEKPEVEEAPEDDKPEDDDDRMVEASIDPSHESEARIEKPKITATVTNPALPATLVDSSFSYI